MTDISWIDNLSMSMKKNSTKLEKKTSVPRKHGFSAIYLYQQTDKLIRRGLFTQKYWFDAFLKDVLLFLH